MKKGLVDPSPGSNSPRAQQSLGPPVLGPTSINMQIKKIFTRTSGSKEQWTLIPMVENYSRTTGPQYQWALGLVGFAKVGRCQDQWTLVLKNPSTLRPKYTWTLGLMDPRTSGPKDQWVIFFSTHSLASLVLRGRPPISPGMTKEYPAIVRYSVPSTPHRVRQAAYFRSINVLFQKSHESREF